MIKLDKMDFWTEYMLRCLNNDDNHVSLVCGAFRRDAGEIKQACWLYLRHIWWKNSECGHTEAKMVVQPVDDLGKQADQA